MSHKNQTNPTVQIAITTSEMRTLNRLLDRNMDRDVNVRALSRKLYEAAVRDLGRDRYTEESWCDLEDRDLKDEMRDWIAIRFQEWAGAVPWEAGADMIKTLRLKLLDRRPLDKDDCAVLIGLLRTYTAIALYPLEDMGVFETCLTVARMLGAENDFIGTWRKEHLQLQTEYSDVCDIEEHAGLLLDALNPDGAEIESVHDLDYDAIFKRFIDVITKHGASVATVDAWREAYSRWSESRHGKAAREAAQETIVVKLFAE